MRSSSATGRQTLLPVKSVMGKPCPPPAHVRPVPPLSTVELRSFVARLAMWPPLVPDWVRGLTPVERAFVKEHGHAALASNIADQKRMCPILRLALERQPQTADLDLEQARWAVTLHMQQILGDPSYCPRDLVASILTAPRQLAQFLLQHLNERRRCEQGEA